MIETERLLLRRWKKSDLNPFSKMNADPRVMEFFPNLLSREQVEAMIERIELHFEERGFGLWAAEEKANQRFIGFVGLQIPNFDPPFGSCIEIGWRLNFESWGKGYATEAAREVLKFAFEELKLKEVIAMAVKTNFRSLGVMAKLGMTYDPTCDFDHPKYQAENPHKRHVLYRIGT